MAYNYGMAIGSKWTLLHNSVSWYLFDFVVSINFILQNSEFIIWYDYYVNNSH